MKTLLASKEFAVGKNNISYVSDAFKNHFYGMKFEKASAEGILQKTLLRHMTEDEITKEWNPDPITLGDFLAFVKDANKTKCYLCRIADNDGVLWAVRGYWSGDGWDFEAYPLDDPIRWCDGLQFLSRRFSKTVSSASSSNTKTLEKAIAIVKEAGYQVAKIV